MSSILISGDSWGYGEWSDNPLSSPIAHLGLHKYLKDAGHSVINMSMPGGKNSQIVSRLADTVKDREFDYIFWFQTDPMRDISFYIETLTIDDLVKQNKLTLEKNYTSLNEIGKKIYCIGGLSKIEDDLSEYENLYPIIPSVPELCVPSYKHPNISFSSWVSSVPRFFQDLDVLVDIKTKYYDTWYTDPELMEYFYPDGQHANRKAHYLIFETISNHLGLTKSS